MMNAEEKKTYGRMALALCLGGLVLAVGIGLAGRVLGFEASTFAYLTFLGFQVAAFVLGVKTKDDPVGHTAFVTSIAVSIASIGFLS